MAAFGQSAAGIHLGLLLVNSATMVLVFLLARDLFDSLAGGIAAAAYSLLATHPSVLGTAAHATHFVAFFSVAASWALWRALRADKKRLLFLSGLLFGAAFLMKQHGVFLSGFGGLMVLIHCAGLRPFAWRQGLGRLAAFAVGVVLPYAVTCLWVWWAGVFAQFWFWTVSYSGKHASEISLADAANCFREQFSRYRAELAIVDCRVGRGAACRPDQGCPGERWFLLAYSAFSFLCVCPGFFFRNHYFIVFLPAAAILGGAAGSWLLQVAGRWQPAKHRQPSANAVPRAGRGAGRQAAKAADARALPGILLWPAAAMLLAAAAFSVWWQREFFFRWTPTRACRELYGPNPFVESPVIADYISRHTTPEQRVAVIGSEPQIYFYAKRLSATRYIYTYDLVEPTPFALQMQQEMCREIKAARPEFIVFVHVDASWLAEPNSSRFIYQWAAGYVGNHYRLVGLADIVSATRTDYYWGDRAAQAHPRALHFVWVFQRKK